MRSNGGLNKNALTRMARNRSRRRSPEPDGGRRRLLKAELDGDGQVHRNGLSVEQSRLILPLAKRFHGCLMEK